MSRRKETVKIKAEINKVIMEAGGRYVSLVLRRMNARAASGLQR